jgi:hypothetical protein
MIGVMRMDSSSSDDRDYWNDKYSEGPDCDVHGEMIWDAEEAEWVCIECQLNEESYVYG